MKIKNWKKTAEGRTWRDLAEKGKTQKRVLVTNDDDPVCGAIMWQRVIFARRREKTVLSCGVWTDEVIHILV